jgi:hypothetical protein
MSHVCYFEEVVSLVYSVSTQAGSSIRFSLQWTIVRLIPAVNSVLGPLFEVNLCIFVLLVNRVMFTISEADRELSVAVDRDDTLGENELDYSGR